MPAALLISRLFFYTFLYSLRPVERKIPFFVRDPPQPVYVRKFTSGFETGQKSVILNASAF